MTDRRRLVLALAIVLAVQFYSRCTPAPCTDLVVDDWAFVARAQAHPNYPDIWRYSAKDVLRPLNLAVSLTLFRAFGTAPCLYTLVGVAGYALLLLAAGLLLHELTRDARAVLLMGLSFALFPNLVESFHWANHAILVYLHIAYILAALCWVRFLKTDRPLWLAAGCLFFAIGLASYEFGVLLPLAFATLLTRQRDSRKFLSLLPFVLLSGFYVAWRFTRGFGWGEYRLTGPNYFDTDFSPWVIGWNLRVLAGWWLGGGMGGAIRNGLDGFSLFGPGLARLLMVGNVLVAAAVCGALLWSNRASSEAAGTDSFPTARVTAFYVVMIAALYAPHILFTASSRHNLFPGLCVATLLAMALRRVNMKHWLPLSFGLCLLCLFVNQGTTAQWREAGIFNRRLFDHLARSQAEWEHRDIVVFDTRTIRLRQTRGLIRPASDEPRTWASYGNAHLLRGFATQGMLDILAGGHAGPRALLDTECGVRVDGETIFWHARYDPSEPHQTPADRAWLVDCHGAAVSGSGR